MFQLAQFCLLGYMLLGLVWFLVELFLFDVTFKRAILMSAVWPIIVWKVKTGRKRIPSSFYSSGDTHSEFKTLHSDASHEHQALQEEKKDERDKGGSQA